MPPICQCRYVGGWTTMPFEHRVGSGKHSSPGDPTKARAGGRIANISGFGVGMLMRHEGMWPEQLRGNAACGVRRASVVYVWPCVAGDRCLVWCANRPVPRRRSAKTPERLTPRLVGKPMPRLSCEGRLFADARCAPLRYILRDGEGKPYGVWRKNGSIVEKL